VVESFLLCGSPDPFEKQKSKSSPILRNDQIFSLIRLCGGSTCLTKEECFHLLKRIHVNQKIDIGVKGPAVGNLSMDNARNNKNVNLNVALSHI
jgi:hypothetical protein